MITPGWCRMMATYNVEMNRRFYTAAARLPDETRRQAAGAFFGSLHGTLCHLVWADMAWMGRLDGGAPPPVAIAQSASMIGDFAEMHATRTALDARIARWTEGLDEAALSGDLHWYSGSAGRDMVRPMPLVVTHMFLHQTHHRGQAHALLTRFGEDTGATDLPFVLD
jgi:uncharacterized damage-inducible protein DinB